VCEFVSLGHRLHISHAVIAEPFRPAMTRGDLRGETKMAEMPIRVATPLYAAGRQSCR
jgi:hypothetical protein